VRRSFAGIASALALLVVLPTAADASAPIGRAFACYAAGRYEVKYIGSFKLVSKHRYRTAPDQVGNQLKGKTKSGRYSSDGDELKFLSGPYVHLLGRFVIDRRNDNYINLYRHSVTFRHWTGISCPES
jgi:hypothetical protein